MADETKPPAPEPAKPAAPAAPKPTPPPPKPGPAPLEGAVVERFRTRFGSNLLEATLDRKQSILVVASSAWLDAARYARDTEQFDMLTDLTAVDWPKNERRFEVVANLYSFPKNERLRLKTRLADGEKVASLAGVWVTANWLERECYDMFGIVFEGHPNPTRILLPEEWQGHPLRKDYDILRQDTDWVRENLGIESGQ